LKYNNIVESGVKQHSLRYNSTYVSYPQHKTRNINLYQLFTDYKNKNTIIILYWPDYWLMTDNTSIYYYSFVSILGAFFNL